MFQAIFLNFRLLPKSTILIKLIQIILDLSVLGLAFLLAYLLRFDFALNETQIQKALLQILIVAPFQFLILRVCKVHKFIWRYVSVPEMNRILAALFLATLPMIILRLTLYETFDYSVIPLSIIILDFFLATAGILGIRLLRRELYDNFHRSKTSTHRTGEKKSVLLIGAGRAGVMTLTEIKSRGDIDIDVKGFVDDDELKSGAIINGVKVLGNTSHLPELVRALEIDQIIISIAQATREDFQRILSICREIPIKVRTIPGLYELLQEKVSVSRIRDIEIEDLLGRSPIQLDKTSIQNFLKHKVVMVTGAGGSIGSELVRQLVHCQTDKLILVERSEFALFQIEREIKEDHPEIEVLSVLKDIGDSRQMEKVFERFRPQVIFHAAAHKHVPMMEINSSEAIKNNILGTNVVGELAGKYNSEAFVLISTDKAVNPTSIMGATKRAAELVVQDLNKRFETRFLAVRFGNVIGSNGSVIPTFREQIKKGGPVTVTHPEMERFFMTIPEASQLVLQAGAIGVGGEIFVLDMGKPVKILDLARETIKLSGLLPDVDIQIKFTGIRPGEKLFEELQSSNEQLSKTIHPKIFIGKIDSCPATEIREMLSTIGELYLNEDNEKIRQFLNDFLPEANLGCKPENLQIEVIKTKDFQISGKEAEFLALGSN
ncbi:MAG: nucleoside-diphosphate sugar epimerase/dehydratase [Pyrinomonadaceae bacterium]